MNITVYQSILMQTTWFGIIKICTYIEILSVSPRKIDYFSSDKNISNT